MAAAWIAVFRWPMAWLLAGAAGIVQAQTPAQMEYERQQREYWRQQEQQRQEQQRQQQQMQDNARRQQEESRRLNAAPGAGAGYGGQGGGVGGGMGGGARGGSSSAADAATAARAMWQKRPPLAADRNPLLVGRWARPPSSRGNSSDPFAGLMALARGGLCEVLFGGGMFEFRADRLVGMDGRTPETELDRVEYRGDSKHVVVLPKTTLKIMEFDVEGSRITWPGQNCVLVRVAAGAPGSAAPAAAQRSAAGAAGVLALSVGERIAGRKLLILKTDAQVALIKGGLQSTPDGSVLQNWMRACQARAQACEKGALALRPYSVGLATTDANGTARTPPLPSGRYWVLGDAKVDNRRLMWNQPVDVTERGGSVTLDRNNAMPVD